jgi:hypothetical protein
MSIVTLGLRTTAVLMRSLARVNIDKVAIRTSCKIGKAVDGFFGRSWISLPKTKKQKKLYRVVQRLINRELDELNIPAELRPKLVLIRAKKIPLLNKLGGGYHPTRHEIMINLDHCELHGRLNYFKLRVFCRHEAKHAQQYTEIARAGLGERLKLNCPELLKKAKKYPIELPEERLLLANNYTFALKTLLIRPLGILFTSNLRKISTKYKGFFEFLDKSTRTDRINFWTRLAEDLKPKGRFQRSLNQYERISKKNSSESFSSYYNHLFEIEARNHQHIFTPGKSGLDISTCKVILGN